MFFKQLPKFSLKHVTSNQPRKATVRAYNDFLSDPSSVPELSVLLNMKDKQLNFVLPPTNPNVPIRETENMRLAMDAILKLTFSEMIALDALLRKESATPPLDAYALCGLPTPQKPWWCYKDRNPGEEPEPIAEALPVVAAAEEVKEEKPKEISSDASLSIKLISYPPENKIKLLKDIRKLKPGMDLNQSKKLVEELPGIIMTGLSAATLKEWQESLDPLGAKYELVQ